ncbi:MAG: hypothetical protein A3G92_03880 [Deltaproteobacteria bacterium RIFCSPLOWO2_12_FULL_38_8]|nr:MAG: hypothetical protein A3G92_03880 [Deltaproteobacteria bacterium RIFCSPLOWO2_12_FULL_38_8]
MKFHKVLIITYYWPPSGQVGMLRTFKFTQYLSEFNWQPTVLASNVQYASEQNQDERWKTSLSAPVYLVGPLRIVKKKISLESHGDIKFSRTRNAIYQTKSMMLEYFNFIKPVIRTAYELHHLSPFDLIFSSSPPESVHFAAAIISGRLSIPWVADLRDLWAYDHYRNKHKLDRFISLGAEKIIFKKTSALVTISEPMKAMLQSVHPHLQNNIHVVTNGFDPNDFPLNNDQFSSQKLTFVYPGKLSPISQNPSVLFDALSILVQRGIINPNKLQFHWYIQNSDGVIFLKRLVEKYTFQNFMKIFKPTSYFESLEKQTQASVLLFIPFVSNYAEGCLTTKFFEYLGTNNPILALPSTPEIIKKLLEEVGGGYVASNPSDMVNILIELYNRFLNKQLLMLGKNKDASKQYTRLNLTRKLAGIFNSVVEHSQ